MHSRPKPISLRSARTTSCNTRWRSIAAMKRSPTFTIRCTPLCCALSNLRSRRRRRATSLGSSSASATSTWSPRAGASAPSWTNPTRSRWLCCSTISTRRSGQQSGWAEPQRRGREFWGSVDQPPDLYPVAGIGQTAFFGLIRAALDRFFDCHSGRDLDFFSGGDLDLEFVVAHFAMPDFGWHGSISSRGLRSHPANTGGWSFDRASSCSWGTQPRCADTVRGAPPVDDIKISLYLK